MSSTVAPAKRAKRPAYDHVALESAILAYQEAFASRNETDIYHAYGRVCRIYNPHLYLGYWKRKYGYLFDNEDEFKAHYLTVFSKTIERWKPRNERGKSRFNGSGEFKNFFWSALQYAYINEVKLEATLKRNLPQICPICSKWVQPLSTHILENHSELLFDKIRQMGYDLDHMVKCPFCKSFKGPKNIGQVKPAEGETQEQARARAMNKALKDHLLSMHSSILFEYFHEQHPDSITLGSKPISVYHTDGEEEGCIYDSVSATPKISLLMELNLTEIQKMIIDKVIGGSRKLSYSSKMGCTREEYDEAMSGLQDAMVIAGIEP